MTANVTSTIGEVTSYLVFYYLINNLSLMTDVISP